MEEQKYYTPAPEDIRIGYEFVFKGNKEAIVSLQAKDIGLVLNSISAVRVPYLTKEQIEAEGWSPANSITQSIFSKNHCHLILQESRRVRITDGRRDVFRGTIRCLNDLRLISKLLGI